MSIIILVDYFHTACGFKVNNHFFPRIRKNGVILLNFMSKGDFISLQESTIF
jgi:hypothetical protein